MYFNNTVWFWCLLYIKKNLLSKEWHGLKEFRKTLFIFICKLLNVFFFYSCFFLFLFSHLQQSKAAEPANQQVIITVWNKNTISRADNTLALQSWIKSQTVYNSTYQLWFNDSSLSEYGNIPFPPISTNLQLFLLGANFHHSSISKVLISVASAAMSSLNGDASVHVWLRFCGMSELHGTRWDVKHRWVKVLPFERWPFSIPSLLQHVMHFLQRNMDTDMLCMYLSC